MKAIKASAFFLLALFVLPASASAQGVVELISVSATGGPSNGYCYDPTISASGRYVAFLSAATNLVSPPTVSYQLFVRDRQSGTNTLVSRNHEGTGEMNSAPSDPFISADGRHVVFATSATDLVEIPAITTQQIFLRHLDTNTTELVSWNVAGNAGGNGYSSSPVISGDNRFVAFVSGSSDLVVGTISGNQIYVRDLVDDTTVLVSAAETDAGIEPGNSGSAGPSISGDGRYVAFESYATNLAALSTSWAQIYVRDTVAGTTAIASLDTLGAAGDSSSTYARITPDGRWVSFNSNSTKLVLPATTGHQAFVRDMISGTTALVSQSTLGVPANSGTISGYGGGLSSDGRYVTFSSYSDNLVPADLSGFADTFVRDGVDETTVRAGDAVDGGEPNGPSESSSISSTGRFVAFTSAASNLVPGDTNGYTDVFVYEVFVPLPDAGVDAGPDAGSDAGMDAGMDAGDTDTGSDTGTGADADADTDTDGDTDADTDTDTDADTDSDSDTGTGDVDTGSDTTDTGSEIDAGNDAGEGDDSSGCACATAGQTGRASLLLLLLESLI